ncbi:MAG: 6-bladed beta-propeller [Candidatus Omnitrophica bacterium]|nr:6-bladed beta-propeller [Candidatus Omnitrophota bacterium]
MRNKTILLTIAILTISLSLNSYEEKKVDITGRISMFKAYKSCLYFLNESEGNIWRFDSNLNFLNKIGKKGEGPGEISFLSNFNFLENKIYTFSKNRLLFFTLNGELISENKFPPRNASILLLKNGNKVEKLQEFSYEKGKVILYKVRFVDESFNQINEVLEEHIKIPPSYEFEAIHPYIGIKYYEKAGFVYISNPTRDFLIMIFDEYGKLMHKIQKTQKKNKISKEYKKEFSMTLIQDPRIPSKEMADAILKQIHFPKYFPAFHSFYLDEGGNVYVRTFKRKKQKTLFEKYSPKGDFLKEYLLEDKNINIVDAHLFISFSEGNYYYLYENEKGEYILYREKL